MGLLFPVRISDSLNPPGKSSSPILFGGGSGNCSFLNTSGDMVAVFRSEKVCAKNILVVFTGAGGAFGN